MAIFDSYIMVDWSGGSQRRGNRSDAIWIAHGVRGTSIPTTESPYSRTEAESRVRDILDAHLKQHLRVLLCFDFAYGYPGGFSAALPTALPPGWKRVWSFLHSAIQDDIGKTPNGKPTNRSNRFDVAETINAVMSPAASALGPFWCLPKSGTHAHIPQKWPGQSFAAAKGQVVQAFRMTDVRAGSDTPFRLFGNGSVGSQVLTGIPRLHNLRTEPSLEKISAVWPFETGWAPDESWIDSSVRVVHAEIYPSVMEPLFDAIKDRGQVRAMWKWAHDLDVQGVLRNKFSIPVGIQAGSSDDNLIRSEEGWILGVP